MSIRNTLTKNFILPLNDTILGYNISKNLSFLLKSQYWTKEELEAFQNKQLKKLISHSYTNVQYYRELFDSLNLKPHDIQTKADLHKLPILTKDIIRKNIKNGKIIAKNIPEKQMIYSSSSGSTGEPLQYFRTKESHSFAYACGIRAWYWMGYRLGDKYVKLSQNPRNRTIKKLQDKVNNTKYLFSQQLTDENFEKIIEKINMYQPKVIRGYPDPMTFLANYIKKKNVRIFSPEVINTTGNILYKEARELIEKQFGCRIFDSYNCEGGANVSECETHNCYHSSMEYAFTEIISNSVEVNNGERGRLITTDLHNYATPFLRYDTQDYVVKAKGKCSCGRELLAIEKIDGRDSDILVTPKGKFLILHNFTGYFEWVDSVDHFQVRQEKTDEFHLFLKVNSRFTKEIEKEIKEYWEEYINEDVEIKIFVVDDIYFTSSGKRRFLIRNNAIKLNL